RGVGPHELKELEIDRQKSGLLLERGKNSEYPHHLVLELDGDQRNRVLERAPSEIAPLDSRHAGRENLPDAAVARVDGDRVRLAHALRDDGCQRLAVGFGKVDGE